MGYQGPSDTLIGFSRANKVVGVTVGKSYDNEPYVTYVRDDEYFRSLFNDKEWAEITGYKVTSNFEGVSGATMTSIAVAKSIVAAAQAAQEREKVTQEAEPECTWQSLKGSIDSCLKRWSNGLRWL